MKVKSDHCLNPVEALISFGLAMITLHFHLQPQYKYELFHICFTKRKAHGKVEKLKSNSDLSQALNNLAQESSVVTILHAVLLVSQ